MFLLSPNSRSPSLCSLCLASPTQISIAPSYGRMDLTMASIPIPMQPSMQQRITDPTPLPRCGRSCMSLPFPSFRINLPAHIIISITNYNVVIAVLSMFIMLAKVCQYLEALRPFQPLSNILPRPLCTSCTSGPRFSPPSSTAYSLRFTQSQ